MTLAINQAGASYRNSERLTGSPAVRITGADVRFVNTESGRIVADDETAAAIQIDADGATIVNEAGGIIRSPGFSGLAIRGASGNDVVDNAGLIAGVVDLGSGADTFIQRSTDAQAFYQTSVMLGDGDDSYRILGPVQNFAPEISGGAGSDRISLEGAIGVAYGNRITGFERLDVGIGVINVSGFSGFTSISLATAEAGQFSAYNFVDSRNPMVDLILPSGALSLHGSTLRSITAGDSGNTLFVSRGTVVSGAVNLAGGNDTLNLYLERTGDRPLLAGGVDGGAGYDTIALSVEGVQSIDLAAMTNFEALSTYTIVTQEPSPADVRLTRYGGLGYISGLSGEGRLTLTAEDASGTSVVVGALGTLFIEAGATVGRYGFVPPQGFPPTDISGIVQGDDRVSVTVLNAGRINGNVELGIGDDIFDTSAGSVGGDIYGYAGNDVIQGSAAGDRIFGGFGGDLIYGRQGGDFILGGSGGDRLFGDEGIDLVGGEAGNDEIHGGADGDNLYGGTGSDVIFGDEGDDFVDGQEDGDFILGGIGNDRLYGGAGVDLLGGEGGNDELHGGADGDNLYGGTGSDVIFGDEGDDFVDGQEDGDFILGGIGNDRLYGGAGIDLLGGEDGNDQLFGGQGNDNLYGGGGVDAVFGEDGNDLLSGGAGNDILGGNGGSDRIEGGAGADTFLYFSTLDSSTIGGGADVIVDFLSGADRIDLSAIDANTTVAGDQAFNFIGISNQGGPAGTLRIGFIQNVGIFLFGDTDNDPGADFILNIGTFEARAGDFLL